LRLSRVALQVLLALWLAVVGGPAMANMCRNIEAELANLPRASSQHASARAAQEAQRLWGHMRSIGCDRQNFLFMGTPPPPECAGLRAQLGALQMRSQMAADGGETRRRQLLSMQISNNCRTSPEPMVTRRSEPLVAGLFDDGNRPRQRLEVRPDDIDEPRVTPRLRSLRKAVCVRVCDGSYFPVQVSRQQLEDDPNAPCRMACPAADAKLFFMQGEDIANAVSPEGEPYAELDNALRFRRSFDPACTCRRAGMTQSENRVLEINPDGTAGGPGFGVVNPDEAVPDVEDPGFLRGVEPTPGRPRDATVFGNRKPPEPPAPPHPPQDIPADRMVAQDQGELREQTLRDGSKRSVRVIAPELSPAPSVATGPSIPGRAPTP
jgi:Protein of unknown function (DUF2865)